MDFIEEVLAKRNIYAGARILDAGCGTGNYAIALAERGFEVTGVDASEQLIEVARQKVDETPSLRFLVKDILDVSLSKKFDGILCRGVLNDIIDDESRQKAFFAFRRNLCRGGVLILDVREWDATKVRKVEIPAFEKSIETDRGKLTFRSVTNLDKKSRKLLVSEQHTLESEDTKACFEYDFTMKCWTIDELHTCLNNAGFSEISYFEDYGVDKPNHWKDRIVAVASYQGVNI